MENSEGLIVFIITIVAAGLTWKMVFDFYKTKIHRVFTHLISVMTGSFMLLSVTFLFFNKDYQRGGDQPEVVINASSLGTVFLMLFVLFIFFKYIPAKNKKNEESMRKPAKKK